MSLNDSEDQGKLVSQLAAAVSLQAQVANRMWIAMTSVAVFAILPHSKDSVPIAGPSIKVPPPNTVSLPFGFGDVPESLFYPIIFIFLVVLTIAFASAHAQQVRAQKLAQSRIDSMASWSGELHPRDLFDMWRAPSLNRVAPLSQSFLDAHQFWKDADLCPARLGKVRSRYYSLLKFVSLSLYFGVPGIALLLAYQKIHVNWWMQALFLFAGLLAGFTLLQVALGDIVYAHKIFKKFLPKTSSSEFSYGKAAGK
jgi:hypothetical protein